METAREPAARRPRGAERDALLRAELTPLTPGERPPALLAAIAVAALLGVLVIVGAATVHDLSGRGGSLEGGLFLGAVLFSLALGMWRRRYWAVLGFEALLAFQALVTALALAVADSLLAAALCVISIALSGLLFWKLVRVMGRVSVTERHSDGAR